MNKVVLVLSDGLRYDTAVASMGYLGHLVESKLASLYKVIGELPSMSRPMYETVHTGVPSSEHGIVANSIVRRSIMPNVFQSAREAGKVTAASAYYWFSELYNRAPFDPVDDREVDDAQLLIQHGRFYTEDEYPDIESFRTAASLVRKFGPDYLLLHPMGMDYHGETYGSDSSQYRNHAIYQDASLAPLIMEWKQRGYVILVTGDHGINKDGAHGGITSEQREVPLFVIQPDGVALRSPGVLPGGLAQGREGGDTGQTISQLQIAPTVLRLMDIPIPGSMKMPALELF